MEAHSFLRVLAETAVGVPLEDAAEVAARRSPSQPASRSSSPAGRAPVASSSTGSSNNTQRQQSHSTANSIFASIAQSLNTAPSSRAQSRASSRRSSVDHTQHHAALLEDTPHRRAVREAVIKRDVDSLRKLSSKGYCHDAMRRLVWSVASQPDSSRDQY